MSKILTEAQRKDFFEIIGNPSKDKPIVLNTNVFVKLFAYTKANKGIRFSTDDVITITPNDYNGLAQDCQTRLGIYIINKFIFEDLQIFGYINKEFTDKLFGKIDSNLAKALSNGDITREQYSQYIDRVQWLFGGPIAHIINPSISSTLVNLPPKAKKLRDELMAKEKAGIEANDPEVSSKIEDAVVTEALKDMRATHDPALALFDAGGGADPYNNYRTMFVMKGAIIDNTGESPTGYKIVKSNYDDGISKEDVALIGDALVTSSFSSGVATQDSGAEAKSYNAIFQRVQLQEQGSFCHTKDTNPVLITKSNKNDYIYRYIKTSATKPVMLTDDNIDQYVGKVVNMYSPLHCKAKDPEYCSCCVGDRPYRIGVKNVGLTFNIMMGSTLNAALKVKHKTKVELYSVTIDDILKYMDHPLT